MMNGWNYNHTPSSSMKPTLVLDLDETLVHSTRAVASPPSAGDTLTVAVEGVLYSVAKRPHVDEFLSMVSQWFNLVVFTASLKAYADPVVDLLGPPLISARRMYRSACTKRHDGGYIKDLDLLGIPSNKVVVLDNSPVSFSNHRDNAILISGWTNDANDRELLYLLPLLDALRNVHDVRSVLGLKDKLRL